MKIKILQLKRAEKNLNTKQSRENERLLKQKSSSLLNEISNNEIGTRRRVAKAKADRSD